MVTKIKTSECLSGNLFIFEGLDGVGKSTLAEKVAEKLRKSGTDVLLLSFPGRESNTIGDLVYSIHHNPQSFGINRISPTSLQLLHIAAHIDCIENRIIPSLAEGKTVILDRYWWSTVAYGIATGIGKEVLDAMINLEIILWGKIKPSILFLITCEKPFRDDIPKNLRSILSESYQSLTSEQKIYHPVEIIENSKPLNIVVNLILAHIRDTSLHKVESQKFIQEILPFQSTEELILKQSNKGHWLPTKTTKVFDSYWHLAAERQEIFFKRFRGDKIPWTNDHILLDYKFTNAYRASDRVSQFLIRHVIYEGPQELDEIFFRILLFKTFNKIETWQLLVGELGQVSWQEYDFKLYDKILTTARKAKRSIYSAAYIMPSGGNSFSHQVKHRNHLQLIEKMMREDLPTRVCDSKSMQAVFDLLRGYPMIGDFLAYQYATDINYSTLTDFCEMSFVVPGPGAKDGLRKCFSDFGGLSEVDLIKLMADRQEDEFIRLGLKFKSLWGRPLQLVDCQNLFCEVDKYARIAHPEIKGLTGRNRIKQKYKPILKPIEYFYPPKWGINDTVKKP
jgi:thymidylate kinase